MGSITIDRAVLEQALELLDDAAGYGDGLSEIDAAYAIIHEALAAPQPEPVAKAWAEGYRQGVEDERTSEAMIGIAGFDAKLEPARQNPYGAAPPQRQPEPVAWRPSWCRDVLQSGCGWFFGAPTKADIEYQRKHGSKIDYAYAHLAPADPPQRQPLSDVDILQGWKSANKVMGVPTDQVVLTFARWLEAMHEIGGDK